MGLFGKIAGGLVGNVAGGALGGLIGGKKGRSAGSKLGGIAGSSLGTAIPGFKTGGKVKRTGLARVHKNEYILPANAKPTKAQRAIVAKNKSKK